jgi:pimeloyl-ACP methyl ester carboxylesterase
MKLVGHPTNFSPLRWEILYESLSFRGETEAKNMTSNVNMLLVHGVCCDGSIWSDVIPLLQEAGHQVLAVQLPLISLADDVARTKSALASLSGPTLLVGHSYGGMVITGAGTDASNATGLVYIAANAPAEGETLLEINAQFPSAEVNQWTVPSYGEHTLSIHPDAFHRVFSQDIDLARSRALAAVQKPTNMDCLTQKAGPPAWQMLPSWYLVSEHDRCIHPDCERWMAQRAGCKTSTIASSHASLIAHAREVADLILTAAQESMK